MQVSQYFTLTGSPLTITSFVRGNCRVGVCLPPISTDADVSYRRSSSGGCELRGTIPGSRADVRRRSTSTCMVNTIATTKIAYPALYDENLWRRCLATKTQKTITGIMISIRLTIRDLASGPNISLPPRKNIFFPFQAS